jgi:putative ABC transport system substrate-binding protein
VCGSAGVAAAPTVGVLAIASPEQAAAFWDRVFGGGLRSLGYDIGRSLRIEYRWAHGDVARYPQLAAELMQLRPTVIVAPCGPSLRAIRDLSRTVAVIAYCADERNFLGEVNSLARPGGQTTGMTTLAPESVGKRLELAKAIVPDLRRLAILFQPDDPLETHWRELRRLQPVFGLSFQNVSVTRAEELDGAFQVAARERPQAMFVISTNLILGERRRIADLALKHRVPTVFEHAAHVEAGGLLSYGASAVEVFGKTAPAYVDKILNGARPGDLPIVQPSQLELVVNATTARALGIKIPQSILLRADRVIE